MVNLLQLTMFMIMSMGIDTIAQTTDVYDKQFYIQEEFMQLLDDRQKNVVSKGEEFISRLIRNRTRDSLPPISLGQYCLLQTIWALASGHVELAETYVNKTVMCYEASSEEWLENFQFDPSLVLSLVKSTSKLDKGNEILKQIALLLSRKYNVLTKAAETADHSLIVWLKEAGLDFKQNGSEAIESAWKGDHADTVNLLLEIGAFGNNSFRDIVNNKNSNGETLLHFAARRGLKVLAKKLLDDGAAVDQKDVNLLTPFYHAVRENEKEVARLLLQRGADLRTRSHNGNTLLHLAVIQNSFVAVSGLLEFGLEIQTENYEGIPPLLLAAERGYNTLMALLIKRGADVNFKTSSGNALLHAAVNRRSLVAVKNLIKQGASIDLKNSEDVTPLYVAANVGDPDLIWFLLNRGAARQDSVTGDSLLHIAARRGDTTAIESLVNLCIPVDELNQKGVTSLYSAASAGNHAAMELLLAKGADLYVTLTDGRRLLHVAAVQGDVLAIESLINAGIYVDVKDTDILTGLCRAVQNDNIVSVALLIEKGANTSFRTTVGDTMLHLAAVSNSHESIQLLVEHGLDIDAENHHNETPLYLAAKNNNTKTANLLVTLGANKNYVPLGGDSLAHLAVANDDVLALKTLYSIGADFNAVNKDGYTPLYTAIRKSKLVTANLMLENGVDLFFINLHNDSQLHIAARNKDHTIIDFLIDKGIYIDSYGSNGSRPVDVALYEGNCHTAEYFIKKGANVRGRNGMNQTVLHSAVIGDCRNFFKNIANHIDNIDPKDNNMQTPLHLAVVLGRTEISETLIKLGADVNSLDSYNSTPFQITAVNRDWNMVSMFLKKDVKLDWTDSDERTLLHLATLENKRDIVQYLTKQMRVNINAQDVDGRIPLHLAVVKGWSGIMSYLIDERVKNIDYQDHEGKTPLHLSAIGGHLSAVKYLLEERADPEATDQYRQTPLIYAAKHHHWEITRILLSEICKLSVYNDTNAGKGTVLHMAILDEQLGFISAFTECLKKIMSCKDSKGRIPLHLAAEKGLTKFMRYLFDKRVPESIDYRDDQGKTPLHLAAMGGHSSAVEYLLREGADPEVTDQHRRSPLIYAAKLHYWGIASTLLSKICKLSGTNDIDEEERTVLHLAASGRKLDIISQNKGCLKKHINSKDSEEKTPLDLAIETRNQEIVTFFFKNYRSTLNLKPCIALTLAKVGFWEVIESLSMGEMGSECRDEKNRTLLHLAAWKGEENIVLFLIQNRIAELDAMDTDNRTALHLAAMEDRHVIARILLKHGARKDINDKDHMTPLTIALANEAWDSVFELLKNETDIHWTDVYNRTILHKAVINGKKEIVKDLLKNTNIDINAKDINLDTALQLAAKQSNLSSHDRQEIINYLVQNGANWNMLDKQKRNILHLVITTGDKETLNYILDKYRLDIDSQDVNLQTPLHMAIINKHYNMAEKLLDYGADKNILDTNKSTPLVYAIEKRFDAYLTVNLLDKFTNVNWLDAYNRSILHLAAMHGCSGVVGKLLELGLKGINIDRSDINGRTPLHYAAQENNKEIVDFLLQAGANGYHLDNENHSPLNLAVVNHGWKAVEALVVKGYYKEHKYDRNMTLLHLAIMDGLRNIVDYLIDNEITDLGARDDLGDTPLHISAHENDVITIKHLLDKRVEKDVLNGIGQNPLAVAMVNGRWKAVSELLKGNCDVEGVGEWNRTLLHYAVLNKNKEIIDQLLSCRNVDINVLDANHETPLDLLLRTQTLNLISDFANINWRDGNGRTLFHHSLKSNFYFSLYSLWKIDAKDNEKQTPLHIAALKVWTYTQNLLNYGLSINAVDINGHLPLHLAAMNGNISVFRKYFQYCCSAQSYYEIERNMYKAGLIRVNARDLLGRTPLQLALDYGHHDIAILLKNNGATI